MIKAARAESLYGRMAISRRALAFSALYCARCGRARLLFNIVTRARPQPALNF
jgi:hypothetical protein